MQKSFRDIYDFYFKLLEFHKLFLNEILSNAAVTYNNKLQYQLSLYNKLQDAKHKVLFRLP